jgi:hypothetical protein
MRQRPVSSQFLPNPFYEGAGTWVLTDAATGRKQHMAIWPPMTRADFLRLARHHIRALAAPLPTWEAPTIHFAPSRAPDDDAFWA